MLLPFSFLPTVSEDREQLAVAETRLTWEMTAIAGQTRKRAQRQDTSFLVSASSCHVSGRSWAVHAGWGTGVPGAQSPASHPERQEEAAGGAGENGRPVAGPFRTALPGEPRSGRAGWLPLSTNAAVAVGDRR